MENNTTEEVKKTVSNFVKRGFLLLKGETEEAMLVANEDKCRRFIKTQINSLENAVDDAAADLKAAQEAEDAAITPITAIDSKSGQNYCFNIVKASNAVQEAEEKLENAKKTLAKFEEILKTKF